VADGQPEAGTDADGLRGEERIEEAVSVLQRDPAAGVLDLEDRRAVLGGARHHAHLVHRRCAFREGLRGVHEEVQNDLPEPRSVRVDERHGAERRDDAPLVADVVRRHGQRRSDDADEIDRRAPFFVRARERAMFVATYARGLLISCATPGDNVPIAARRSLKRSRAGGALRSRRGG
jgi:hypothetical protein